MILTKEAIKSLFAELNELLSERGISAELGLVGGAAMCLVYQARDATKDVDAIFVPKTEVMEAAKEISSRHEGLPEDWLNDSVKGFLSPKIELQDTVLRLSNLHVWTPEPQYMLAMKTISARVDTSDRDDVKVLIKFLGITSVDEVVEITLKYYPQKLVPTKTLYFLEELFETDSRF